MNAPAAPRLVGWAWLSIGAAVTTIALKSAAYLLTGSVGLLSDALESVVNLVAAVLALVALTIAARPADDSHHFGHGKVEYFSAGAEGLMILVAAVLIIVSAVQRLITPQPLEDLGVGLAITVVATVINGVVGWLVLRAGRRHRSSTLVADGKHLLTDVWTSVGVVVGVGLVAVTGWVPLDSLVAIAVALNILWTGWGLVRHAMDGLMDHALPPADVAKVTTALRTVQPLARAGRGGLPRDPDARGRTRALRVDARPGARVRGPCPRATTCSSRWRRRSCASCPVPRCTRTSSRARTRAPTATRAVGSPSGRTPPELPARRAWSPAGRVRVPRALLLRVPGSDAG